MTDFEHPPARDGRLGELLRLAGPAILSRLGIMTMGLIDAIVVGQFSSAELAYHGLGWAPTSVILTTAVGLLTGVQVMASRYVGEGRAGDTGMALRRALGYAAALGLAATVVSWFGGPAFIRASGVEPALAEGAGQVMQIFALSLLPYLLFCAMAFWLEGLGRPGPGMVAMWLANLVNLALALLLVPGHVAGIEGAVGGAWATFGARVAVLLLLAGWLWRWQGSRTHGAFARGDDGRGAEQRRIGYGAGASYFVESMAFAGMAFVAGRLATLDVAAWSIVINLAAIVFMGPLGIASATSVLVGRAFGARDRADVVRSGWLGFGVVAALTALISVAVWVGDALIARAYTADPQLIALVAPALTLSCLFFVADGLQVVAASALRARGDIVVPTITHIISYALIMLPLGWVLAHNAGLGLNGIVWSVIVASLVSAGFLMTRFLLLARRPLG
ncbi:MATE family efflux transporter [Bradyrhizobium sp.]|uniref:MATE family efflux transporter n=1 Tax=Bradyrhizobium sp. TaxID=376 RepID=UPI0025B81289|nr:MATE family efflux transporter [Bradyrhizobium sp.]MCA3255280.1 MATE family efflux transporter [Alphaproteobacteria bacterium]MCA3572012.1 MATE family efflux transporter [Bradyrhizobium sp.]